MTDPSGREEARPRWAIILALVILVAPILLWSAVEVVSLIWVGGKLGLWPTFGLVSLTFFFGAWVALKAGRSSWQKFREAASGGGTTRGTLDDAGLIFSGAFLLMIPGFLSDLLGLCCVIPFTRPAIRWVLSRISRRAGKTSSDQSKVVISGEVVVEPDTEKVGPLILEGTNIDEAQRED